MNNKELVSRPALLLERLRARPLEYRGVKLFGILVRKERWGLSWRGWLIILTGIVVTFYLFLFRDYPFLAVTHGVNTNVLVVEGCVNEYEIIADRKEFQVTDYL